MLIQGTIWLIPAAVLDNRWQWWKKVICILVPYHQATEQRLSLGCESPQFWFAYVNCANLYYKALVRVDPLSSEKYNIYIYIQNFKKMVRNTWHRPVVLKECNSFAASSSESVCDRPCRLSSVSREVIPEKRDTLYIPMKLDGATQLSPTHMGLVSSLKPHVI